MFVKLRFNLFSMLFLLFLFTGCNSKISVDLLSKLKSSKNGETSSSSNYELTEYKLTIAKKNDPSLSITTVDSNYVTRKIDLGINAEKIKTIAYGDNFWIFRAITEEEAKEGNYRTYYLNLNDANPVAVNFQGQTDIPCVSEYSPNPWMVIIRGYLYCANTNASKLTRINLSNYSDKTVFNTVTISQPYSISDLPLEWTHFFVGSDLYLRVGEAGLIKYIRINGNSVTAKWTNIVYDMTTGMRWMNNELVSVSGDGEVGIYTGTSTSESVIFPGYDRSLNYIPFSRYRFLIDKDIYYFMCSAESYAGALGLYKTNLDDTRNPTTDYYDLGSIRCDELSNFQGFNLNGSLYFKGYDTVEKKVYLYRFRPGEAEKFQKIVAIADKEFDTFTANDSKQTQYAFYSDSENLCFSGWNGSAYVPYCIDQNHNLNRMGQVSSDDPFTSPVKFKRYGNDLLYLAKADRVRLYKADLTSHVSSEVTSVNSLLNLDFAWEHVYPGQIGVAGDTILTGENSFLGVVSFTDKNVDVTIKDIKGNEYKHALERVNNSEIKNLYAYKNKTLFAYGQNEYFDLYVFEQDKERKIPLARRILNTGGDLISQVNGQYFYYININYDLMRIDMASEEVVLIAESVQDFTFKNGMIIYINDEPGTVYVVNGKLEKRLVTDKLYESGKTDFRNIVNVIGNNVYVTEIDDNTGDPHVYLAGANGVNLELKDTHGNRLIIEEPYGLSTPNDRYIYFENYDYDNDISLLNLFDNQTGITLASYPLNYENIFLSDLMLNQKVFSKLIIEANLTSVPNYAKFSEYIEGSFEEHTYHLPAVINSDKAILEGSKFITINDNIFLALSYDGANLNGRVHRQ